MDHRFALKGHGLSAEFLAPSAWDAAVALEGAEIVLEASNVRPASLVVGSAGLILLGYHL